MIWKTTLTAVLLVLLPALAQAADITGVPKIREGDSIQIGSTRLPSDVRRRTIGWRPTLSYETP